jgi:hypothetical protein
LLARESRRSPHNTKTASIPLSADSHPCFFTRDPDALRVRYWHIASIRCSAVIRQQSEVNRTCHGHRRSDAAGGLLPRPICVSGYRAFSAARYTRARAFPSGVCWRASLRALFSGRRSYSLLRLSLLARCSAVSFPRVVITASSGVRAAAPVMARGYHLLCAAPKSPFQSKRAGPIVQHLETRGCKARLPGRTLVVQAEKRCSPHSFFLPSALARWTGGEASGAARAVPQ